MSLYSCDMCQREVFDSKAALQRHVAAKHASLVPDSGDLSSLSEQLRPVLAEVLEKQPEKWRRWGEMTFTVSAQRDAGAKRLAEACDARRQLECVVQRWRPTAKVYIFGSSVAMGLWDGLSDIDFSVIDVDAMENGQWPPNEKNAVRGVANHLRRIGFAHPHLEAIEHARVPIIKHTAPSAFTKLLEAHYETVLARSARFMFDSLLEPEEMREVEQSVAKILGAPPERLWWDVVSSRHTLGVTAATTTSAVALMISPPSTSPSSSTAAAAASTSEHGNSKKSADRMAKSPIAALPVHDELRPEIFRIDFDLSFRAFGVRNSLLLRHYLNGHVCARPGALVLKDWSKNCGINDSMHGYLTSYAINILWIYFLVQQGLVPFKDPKSIPHSVRDVEPEPTYVPLIPSDIAASPESAAKLYENMGRLLVAFFAFYTFVFDWDRHVVSLNRPGTTTKHQIGWDEANETTLAGGRGKNTRYDLCIEDPYEDNLNLGRHIGAVRSRKFHDEFKRALLSLVKGDFADSCVFPAAADSFDARKERTPRVEDVTTLLQVALDVISADPNETTTTAVLRAAFHEHANDAFERVRNCWGWVQLTRAMGLKIVGDVIRPFRAVSAMRKRNIAGGSGSNNAQQPGQQPQDQVRKEVDFVSLDLSDRVLATFVRDLSTLR